MAAMDWNDLARSWEDAKRGIKRFTGDYIVPFGIGTASLLTSGLNKAEKMAGAQGSMVPLEYRTYLSSVGNTFQQGRPLTEEELFPEDLKLLKKLVEEKEAAKKDKKSNARKTDEGVVYGYDYKTGYDKSKVPGRESARKTLGRFDYKPEDQVITVQDVYDFAVPQAIKQGSTDYGTEIIDRMLAGDLMGAASVHGARVLPSDVPGAGRKVNIKIKKK